MNFFLAILTLIFVCFGCKKNEINSTATCFKGKYLGQGCWTVIQIVQPVDGRFVKSTWGTVDTMYKYAVGVKGLPDNYKNGKSFYFTISSIDSNLIHTANCTIPQYAIGISTFSDTQCTMSGN